MSQFHCQKFSLNQSLSAMKVCTDSMIFGAYADISGVQRLLDIGAGTGLLSLMAAQRGAKAITAVEFCKDAYQEAVGNAQASPWPEQITVFHDSIQHFSENHDKKFDGIICNPPFFANHRASRNTKRRIARHNDTLSLPDLLAAIDKLLTRSGSAFLLLPCHALSELTNILSAGDLFLVEITTLYSSASSRAKLMMVTLGREQAVLSQNTLQIYNDDRSYSEQAASLLSAFLLRFQ